MVSIATAIQYTIRSNLSVTIVAMVNSTELEEQLEINELDRITNKTFIKQPKLVGCPLPEQPINSTNQIVKHLYKVS